MLNFSIILLDDNNKPITFENNQKKKSISNFKIDFFEKNRKLRPTRSTQQIKEEQINFLLEDIEKNLVEYKKATELKKRKQLSDIEKVLQGAKKNYDLVVLKINN